MVECEFCGKQVTGRTYKIAVEGVTLIVCQQCFMRLINRKVRSRTTYHIVQERKPYVGQNLGVKHGKQKTLKRRIEFEYEIVEDYAERIRETREKLGWSLSVLAQKIREKESVIRRIEAGKLKPTIELARKLEKILKITLLEPIVPEYTTKSASKENLTLGDIVVLRKRKRG